MALGMYLQGLHGVLLCLVQQVLCGLGCCGRLALAVWCFQPLHAQAAGVGDGTFDGRLCLLWARPCLAVLQVGGAVSLFLKWAPVLGFPARSE